MALRVDHFLDPKYICSEPGKHGSASYVSQASNLKIWVKTVSIWPSYEFFSEWGGLGWFPYSVGFGDNGPLDMKMSEISKFRVNQGALGPEPEFGGLGGPLTVF